MSRLARQIVVFAAIVLLGGIFQVAVAQQDRGPGQTRGGAGAGAGAGTAQPAAGEQRQRQERGQGQAQSSSQRRGKFEVYEDQGGKFRWRLKASNGQIIASSGQGFADKRAARDAIDAVKRAVADAPIEEAAQTASSSEGASSKSNADATKSDADATKSDTESKSTAGSTERSTSKGRSR